LVGNGKKTARRLVLHLVRQPEAEVEHFAETIARMRREIRFCRSCHNLSDTDYCPICTQSNRSSELICVVENVRDVMAIENTQQFNGKYHVLGGVISPLDGIGPDQLQIESLLERVRKEHVRELVFALNPNIQGDTTIYYIGKKLADQAVVITTIARGIAFGGELEYADEMTLARSISNRIPVDRYINTW